MLAGKMFDFIYSTEMKKIGNDLDYAIRTSGKRIYLIFRGTNSKIDWKNNFTFPAKVYGHQKESFSVHRGYGEVWNPVHTQVMQEFLDACSIRPDYTPMIIGHSYGGAMSILAAESYHYITGKKIDVVTFGAPKIIFKGQKYFRECCNIKQFVDRNDIVPKILFFYKGLLEIKVGEKFNLFKMLKDVQYPHCNYGNTCNDYTI